MKHSYTATLRMFALLLCAVTLLLDPQPAQAALWITGVTPSTVPNNVATTITVSGTDFVDGAVVSLDGYGSLSTTFVDGATLTALLPAGAPAGVYTLRVTNPDASWAFLEGALTVTAPPATPTSTSPPVVNTYERPVIVVNSYSTSRDTISRGQDFDLFIELYNAGQKYAANIVVTFAVGDLIPRETGGVIAVPEIAPGNRDTLRQAFTVSSDTWGKSIVSLDMTVTYTDQYGAVYTEQFTITLPLYQPYYAPHTPTPTPTATPTPTPPPNLRPQLVITGYGVDLTPLQPGMQFTLQLTIQNLGNARARRVTMIVGGGSGTSSGPGGTQEPGGISGASGEFTNFAPLGTSNVQSLGDLEPGDTLAASQLLIVNVSTNPGAYPMKISFVYVDENNTLFTDDQVITLLVYSLPNLDISFYRDPGTFFVGQPNMLPLQIVNLGRKSAVLGNMRVEAVGAQLMNNVILIGALETGGYFTLDATLIPDQAGPLDLVVTVDYTDDFSQVQLVSKTLTVEVMEMFMPEPGDPGMGEGDFEPPPPAAPETIWQKIWRFILGLLGLDSGVQAPQAPGEMPYYEQEVPVEVEPVPGPPLKGP